MNDENVSKVRKLGNSVAITLPKKLNVSVGQEFIIVKKENGSITLIPKVENYFKNAKPGEFYTPEINVDYIPSGDEASK
ncbi:Programmed cell death antitoxin MazE [Pediococcus damnosus]|uniref:Programmed cell death antitoxin MazE n=1 Tax=Pediococcus damnosus TaxID=51663 RepID=A0AAC9B330_9LACO|nr:AbrB/MazE/SpoVT family DNA-binding domain-containing protein [Pediococcus damnosus]AMV60358.1 Programmed cell death antitoxin MazE [Pediococcus damnosus]AMV63241.1 Programmed cell death antitoxin MazE [Pediococcus damnosus]AMV64608.1 Programmed cell death antitoxin MazE [Pediococcus damnosus]AMV66863.1 Programmed cell death antitoxin MazE [Pediococcus damnosus]AMV69528.1 Programmed cell death antitoxin MazE [Pediococcus damnosus]